MNPHDDDDDMISHIMRMFHYGDVLLRNDESDPVELENRYNWKFIRLHWYDIDNYSQHLATV